MSREPEQVISMMDVAVKRFGEYQWEDKGPAEVMQVDEVETILRDGGVQATVDTLNALSEHPHGQPLINHLVMTFVEDETWPELTDRLIADKSPHVTWLWASVQAELDEAKAELLSAIAAYLQSDDDRTPARHIEFYERQAKTILSMLEGN